MDRPWAIASRGTKRTHDEMNVHHRNSSRPRSTQSPSTSANVHLSGISIGNRNNNQEITFEMPRIAGMRFPGDGFDFRRPASLNTSPTAHTSRSSSSTTTSTDAELPPTDLPPRITLNGNGNGNGNMGDMDGQGELEVIDLTSDIDEPGMGVFFTAAAGSTPAPPEIHSTFGRAARGPRFGPAEIIDLSGDSPEVALVRHQPGQGINPANLQRNAAPSANAGPPSPEITFVSSRPLRLPTPPVPRQPRPMRFGNPNTDPVDLNSDDDIQVTGFRRVTPPPAPIIPRTTASELRGLIGPAGMERLMDRIMQRGFGAPPRTAVRRGGAGGVFVTPDLNFGAVGFDLGMGTGLGDSGGGDEREGTQSPPIVPPEKAPEGWTRSPQEDGFYVCENCGEELCVGLEERKRQVFVGRCGHMYCGDCTKDRHATKRKKVRESYEKVPRSKPFKECVVPGCDRKLTSKTAMIQLFL
ncbi:hypothetical protein EJ08DRAFT_641309 [Tothia fuscella]|uniref:RING-type domain-containing protein n=1 Tax=Tothia fuscella TaxID=1048955 RepID=A0A9P4NH79_9PEZI|nr:hypothetical protein EJ08DRAFT_641309 [Tothia fuscella]